MAPFKNETTNFLHKYTGIVCVISLFIFMRRPLLYFCRCHLARLGGGKLKVPDLAQGRGVEDNFAATLNPERQPSSLILKNRYKLRREEENFF